MNERKNEWWKNENSPKCKNSIDEYTEAPLEREPVLEVHVGADHHRKDGFEEVKDQKQNEDVSDQVLVVLDEGAEGFCCRKKFWPKWNCRQQVQKRDQDGGGEGRVDGPEVVVCSDVTHFQMFFLIASKTLKMIDNNSLCQLSFVQFKADKEFK